jgi:hypothetical protein
MFSARNKMTTTTMAISSTTSPTVSSSGEIGRFPDKWLSRRFRGCPSVPED